MGLAGRAIILAQSGGIADASPYLDVTRAMYTHPTTLAEDIAEALTHDDHSGVSLWSDWEMEGGNLRQARFVSPEQYPLTFFTVRLMELCSGPMPTLNLQGSAKQVLEWFVTNSPRLESHVRGESTASSEQLRELATAALGQAVETDDTEEDYHIIGRELSEDRVSAFKSDVYASAFAENSVERLFERAGAFLYLAADAAGGPEERGYRKFLPKASLTDSPENTRIYDAPLRGDQWGRGLSDDLFQRLCEALDDSPEMTACLDTPEALLAAIDGAINDLNPSSEAAVVLSGNWGGLELRLHVERPEGWEPAWQAPSSDSIGEIARYRGHPLLMGLPSREQALYVVEPRAWGCLVRAQFESAQDLFVEVSPVSGERARELLDGNPRHFPDEPDEESKLRKLQTCVELAVYGRTGFRAVDQSRARRIMGIR